MVHVCGESIARLSRGLNRGVTYYYDKWSMSAGSWTEGWTCGSIFHVNTCVKFQPNYIRNFKEVRSKSCYHCKLADTIWLCSRDIKQECSNHWAQKMCLVHLYIIAYAGKPKATDQATSIYTLLLKYRGDNRTYRCRMWTFPVCGWPSALTPAGHCHNRHCLRWWPGSEVDNNMHANIHCLWSDVYMY